MQDWQQTYCSPLQVYIIIMSANGKETLMISFLPTFSDSVSRSGMFCAIATTIDRCKTESVVDVFQVVKAQRIQKPGLVLTVVSMT